MDKSKAEEIAQWVLDNRYSKGEGRTMHDHEMYHGIIDRIMLLSAVSEHKPTDEEIRRKSFEIYPHVEGDRSSVWAERQMAWLEGAKYMRDFKSTGPMFPPQETRDLIRKYTKRLISDFPEEDKIYLTIQGLINELRSVPMSKEEIAVIVDNYPVWSKMGGGDKMFNESTVKELLMKFQSPDAKMDRFITQGVACGFAEWIIKNDWQYLVRDDRSVWIDCKKHEYLANGSDLHYENLMKVGVTSQALYRIYLKEYADSGITVANGYYGCGNCTSPTECDKYKMCYKERN